MELVKTLLFLMLTKLTEGYKPKKSKILDDQNGVIRFLKEASDDDHLFMKVVAIMGLYGACRSDELYKLELCNVDDRKSVMIVSLITKTKKDRSFCITDQDFGVSVLEIIRKYFTLRPKHVPHKKFFLNYRDKKCTIQPVGINTTYKIPKNIANFLTLSNPEMFTVHYFRRFAARMLANSGADLITLKRAGGWKSSSVAETYIEDPVNSKIAVSKHILSGIGGIQNQTNTSVSLPQQSNTSCSIPIGCFR